MDQVRTDLALEENERIQEEKQEETRGVRVEESYMEKEDIRITTVHIDTENAARQLGKPRGTYVTIEASSMSQPDEEGHREVSRQMADILKEMLPRTEEGKELSVLIAGLGNRNVTPDALGPQTVDHLCITRHMLREFGRYAYEDPATPAISSIVPGVMGQTGMETVEIIQGIVENIKPDALIVIDALAARSVRRLGRTIQIADTGISPGSGVGNHRNSITRETIGVPVIAIGIPTVVEAATIVSDSVNNLAQALSQWETMGMLSRSWNALDEAEQRNLIRELLSPQLNNMFVTPKDIDASINAMSFTVAEGLNMAFLGQQS